MSDFSSGGPPVAGRFEGAQQPEEPVPPPEAAAPPPEAETARPPRSGRRVLLALALVAAMLASAFGLGIGVMRAVEGEEPAPSLRFPARRHRGPD